MNSPLQNPGASMTMKKAVVFGSTGFVGAYVLQELLSSPDYEQVIAVARKDLNISHPKLRVLIADYDSVPALKDQLAVDEVFIALGTTKNKTPDKREYYRIDHDYPVLAATLAKEGGAKSVLVVSAVGSDPDSSIPYVKTKGETDRDIINLGFDHTHIFRPSMIMGDRKEKRRLEKTLMKLWSVIDVFFIGGAKKYRGSSGPDIARAMMLAAKRPSDKVNIYYWQEMHDLLAG